MDDWIAVSRKGLAKEVERRGIPRVVLELFQNAWDQNITTADITLRPLPGRPFCELCVEDDDPDGFKDLTHAYTMFAESEKKQDPTQAGQFNIGEKLVLSICESAEISSTTGSLKFDKHGRRRTGHKRACGSKFYGIIKMTREQCEEAINLIGQLIVPVGIKTTFNGKVLECREPVAEFEASLRTYVAGKDGIMRPTTRKTTVQVFEPTASEVPSIYELGIPVVETDDKWHYNILQKVPINWNRDNVTPKYLDTLRTLVFNEMHGSIEVDEANDDWVRSATSDERCSNAAITTALDHRFGKKRVSFDPRDLEANMKATSEGHNVIHGNSLHKQEWKNARAAKAIKPAGQVTPCKLVFNGTATAMKHDDLSQGMKDVARYTQAVAKKILNIDVSVSFLDKKGQNLSAYYERTSESTGNLVFYVQSLGRAWFNEINNKVQWLVIHELGHAGGHHLKDGYHNTLCKLGAGLASMGFDTIRKRLGIKAA